MIKAETQHVGQHDEVFLVITTLNLPQLYFAHERQRTASSKPDGDLLLYKSFACGRKL